MGHIKGTLLRNDAKANPRNFLKRLDMALLVLADADRICPNELVRQRIKAAQESIREIGGTDG